MFLRNLLIFFKLRDMSDNYNQWHGKSFECFRQGNVCSEYEIPCFYNTRTPFCTKEAP